MEPIKVIYLQPEEDKRRNTLPKANPPQQAQPLPQARQPRANRLSGLNPCKKCATVVYTAGTAFIILFSLMVLYIETKLAASCGNYPDLITEGTSFSIDLSIAIAAVSAIGALASLIIVLIGFKDKYSRLRYVALAILLTSGLLNFVAGCHQSTMLEAQKKDLEVTLRQNLKLGKQWDALQIRFKCCGVTGAKDWQKSIPSSCCYKSNPCTAEIAHKLGCHEVLDRHLDGHLTLAVVFLFTASVTQGLCIAAILVLICF